MAMWLLAAGAALLAPAMRLPITTAPASSLRSALPMMQYSMDDESRRDYLRRLLRSRLFSSGSHCSEQRGRHLRHLDISALRLLLHELGVKLHVEVDVVRSLAFMVKRAAAVVPTLATPLS